MLYLSFLTIFAPLYLEDLRRLHRKKGDCCGICCCKEDSFICCFGLLLTNRQRCFSGLDTKLTEEEQLSDQKIIADKIDKSFTYKSIDAVVEPDESSSDSVQTPNLEQKTEMKEEEYASGIEKFIATILAPELMTLQGRIAVLVIWSLTALCAIYGATQLETNFAQSFFIPPGSDIE